MTIEQKAREIAASALRVRKMPSPSYEAIDVEAGKYDEHSSVQAARLGIIEGRRQAFEEAAAKVKALWLAGEPYSEVYDHILALIEEQKV